MYSNHNTILIFTYRFFFSNFAILPICGIVQSRGWQIITVAFEPKSFGDYYENWELNINNNSKVSKRTPLDVKCC